MTTIGDKQEYYVDQYLLARVFWPIAKDDAVSLFQFFVISSSLQIYLANQVIHDSHCCTNNWNSLPSWPYPTQRVNGTFISDRRGSSWARPNPCPIECRPPDHRDWEYCWLLKKCTLVFGRVMPSDGHGLILWFTFLSVVLLNGLHIHISGHPSPTLPSGHRLCRNLSTASIMRPGNSKVTSLPFVLIVISPNSYWHPT